MTKVKRIDKLLRARRKLEAIDKENGVYKLENIKQLSKVTMYCMIEICRIKHKIFMRQYNYSANQYNKRYL